MIALIFALLMPTAHADHANVEVKFNDNETKTFRFDRGDKSNLDLKSSLFGCLVLGGEVNDLKYFELMCFQKKKDLKNEKTFPSFSVRAGCEAGHSASMMLSDMKQKKANGIALFMTCED